MFDNLIDILLLAQQGPELIPADETAELVEQVAENISAAASPPRQTSAT